MKTIDIILPCYNEEKALPLYFKAVDKIIEELNKYRFNFILVNDGSKDKTYDVMYDLYREREDITIVNLSRNFGQNPAFTAGLETSKGDYVIMMDADLQDPVELIKEIIEKLEEGYDIVSPRRVDRSTDTKGKRNTTQFFYRFINKIEGRNVIPENVNCFRGLTKKIVEQINNLEEKDRYLVSEIPFVGYKTYYIDFKREERVAGKSKYNYKKMITYALDIISVTTSKPLYLPIIVSFFSSFFFFFTSLITFILYILNMTNVLPYSGLYFTFFLINFILLIFSLLVFIIGILAVYLHNILINTRSRPNNIIESVRKPEDK